MFVLCVVQIPPWSQPEPAVISYPEVDVDLSYSEVAVDLSYSEVGLDLSAPEVDLDLSYS